ncbi:AsnC family transcriptional regulator [Marinitenerispora sediminis]|uniref:AsnC family transcriptional regulator n=1 Tax=Marinitenerispora sediminis TaxID=1931232 RepID=A0A368TAS9_9ACTN|nr:AsnC family transcriptional regulator [Marinitenerispora sediminis]RCV58446.1 AsnC family transcriptional regulator [Marinitenerispora sediminis]RCV61829.1 AsnC family transcriptional regulator [Marinitenerispora sediminis]
MDDLDRDLIAALQHAPRAPVNVLADVLDTSPSTVKRRMHRLLAERLVRVIGQLAWSAFSDAHPRHVWISTAPGQAQDVARRLAARPEIQLVAITSGRADVYCVAHPPSREHVRDLLTRDIPSVPGVAATQSDLVLRAVTRADSWRLDRLSAEQVAALAPRSDPPPTAARPGPLSDQETRAARLLHADARLNSGDLARALGASQSTAYRLIQSLLERGVVRPRVEVEPALLGMRLEAVLSVSAAAGSIADVGTALARHRSARYVSVVAGASSVIHHGAFRDEDQLADFLSDDLAGIPGVTAVQVSVVLDVLRRYWIHRSGVRLGEPVPLLTPG